MSPEAEVSFQNNKEALISPPILTLVDFSLVFLIECNDGLVKVEVVLIKREEEVVIKQNDNNSLKLLDRFYNKLKIFIMGILKYCSLLTNAL